MFTRLTALHGAVNDPCCGTAETTNVRDSWLDVVDVIPYSYKSGDADVRRKSGYFWLYREMQYQRGVTAGSRPLALARRRFEQSSREALRRFAFKEFCSMPLVDLSEYLSIADGAREANLSASYVRQLAIAGELGAIRTPHGRLIRRADLERFIAEREARRRRDVSE